MRKLIRFGELLPLLALLLIAAVLALFGRWEDLTVVLIGTLACLYYTVNGVRERMSENKKHGVADKKQTIATSQPAAAVTVKAVSTTPVVTQSQPVATSAAQKSNSLWEAWMKFFQRSTGYRTKLQPVANRASDKVKETVQTGSEKVATKATVATKAPGNFLQKKAAPYLLKRPRILFAVVTGLCLLFALIVGDGFPLISFVFFAISIVFLLKKEVQTKDAVAAGVSKLFDKFWGLTFSRKGLWVLAGLGFIACLGVIGAEGNFGLSFDQAFLLALVAYVLFFLPGFIGKKKEGDKK